MASAEFKLYKNHRVPRYLPADSLSGLRALSILFKLPVTKTDRAADSATMAESAPPIDTVFTEPNLGPLTTVWEQPSSCSETLTRDLEYRVWLGADSPETFNTGCYPSSFRPKTVYSAGVCPSGWAYGGEPSDSAWTTAFPTELTVRQCCPG